MKIFSSFDTSHKKNYLEKKQKIYWPDKVHILEKSKFFLVMYGIIPAIFIVISSIVLGYVSHQYMWLSLLRSSWIGIFTLIIGLLYHNIIGRIIDYKMDYCIITPDEVIFAEQKGLFQRNIRTLDAIKIKSISVKRKNSFNSIFNNGMMIFMSDGDEKMWEISITYIHNPEYHKNIVVNIID